MTWIHLAYMLASVLFILGIKRLATVRTARQGNFLASGAMLIAIVATLLDLWLVEPSRFDPYLILFGVLIGSGIGAYLAITVRSESMPEMVALLNGLGGAASLFVGLSFFYERMVEQGKGLYTSAAILGADSAVSVILSILIGAVTVTGSVVAYGKLSGAKWMKDQPILLPNRHLITLGSAVFIFLLSYLLCFQVGARVGLVFLLLLLTLGSLALGVLLVIPIGGADMPVVISLLNSYSGIAASMTGFVIGNNLLIISGSLVGASGIILTQIMCKAMNRNLLHVLAGGFGMTDAAGGGAKQDKTKVKSTDAEELAQLLDVVEQVVIVPGYGMAVGQAQHAVRDLANLLKARGATVKYAIHPVAGRMPGHMNVLLAEADVPYEELYEMDEINSDFKNTDISIVIGANDVVNPEALDKKDSPIYGMPILRVHDSRLVVVVKRSLSPGYAGIPNPLFEMDNTRMFFADARQAIEDTVRELKEISS
jgi:NAD(P) transhydrogenase subunit beta